MSAEEQARFTVQSLLARGLGATEVARRTGLSRASEVWGGDRPLDRPAWYLWLEGSPGAYRLGLEEAEGLPAGGWRARFTIRYYPAPDEPAFRGFSAEERAAVEARLLDATGTPHIETASRIPEPHFVVGGLEWAAAAGGEAAVLGLSTLDRLLVRDGAEAPLRDVPGWRLGASLLTTLAGLHAQLERRALRRLVLSRQPGFEQAAAAGEPAWRDTAEAVQGEALLLFEPPEEEQPAGQALLEALLDPAGEVTADERFDATCRHPASLEADPRLALPVVHAWFGGAPVREDRIACAC